MLFPKKTKFKKQFKGKIKGKTIRGSLLKKGTFAIKSLEVGKLNSKQIESARKIIKKKMKKIGFLWIRIFPDKPITSKPTENRMGKGKGSVQYWASKIKKGQILFEISGISNEEAFKALKSGSKKLPILTKYIYK